MTPERWIALVAGTALLVACWRVGSASLSRGDGLITVETVFLTVWGAVLVLFAIPWIRYTQTSLTAWVAIYGSIATFLVGCWLARRRLASLPSERPDPAEGFNARRFGIVWLALFTLGMIGFAGFIRAVDAAIGWEALINNPSATRALQSTSAVFKSEYGSWKFLTYFNQVAFLLWTIGLRGRLFKGPWRIAWALGWLSLVPYVFTGDRTLILTSLTWAILFQLLWRPPAHPKRLVAIVVVATMLLLGVFVALGSRAGKSLGAFPEIAAQMTVSQPQQLALPYLYLTGNIPTFSQLTEDPIRPHTDGKLTLLPAVKILHRLGLGGTPPEQVGSFYPIPFETFNNYGWLGNLWMDFGLIGCLIVPLLFGFLACWLVLLALRKGSLLSIWIGSLALFVTAYTPMINKLASTLIWQYAIAGPFILLAIRDNPGPADWLRGAGNRARALTPVRRVAAIAVAAIAFGSLIAIALAGKPRNIANLTPSEQLAATKALALKTAKDGQLPGSFALASRLRAAVPGATFQEVCTANGSPRQPGIIGVWASGSTLRLSERLQDGKAIATSPANLDLARPGRVTVLRITGGKTALVPNIKGLPGMAFASLTLPSLPPAGTRVTVRFSVSRPGTVGAARPYMLLRFANGPGFQHCSEAAPLEAQPGLDQFPVRRVGGKAPTGGATFEGATTTATAGLVRIDLLAASHAEAIAVRDSLLGPFTVTLRTAPAG